MLLEGLVFCLVELFFRDEVFLLSFFLDSEIFLLSKAKAMLAGIVTPYFLLLFKFLDVLVERVVNFFSIDDSEALLLPDILFAFLETLGPLT